MSFGSYRTHQTFTVLVHFGVQFTAGKPKILLTTKISAKTISLGISNNVSPRPKKNHRILIKLSESNILCTQIGFKMSPWGHTKVSHRNSSIAYNRTIHLYFLNVKFEVLSFFCSRLYPEKITTYF